MDAFAPCRECRRHVRVNELRCPFCGAAVTAVRVVGQLDLDSLPRRARHFAVRFGIASAAVSCGAVEGTDTRDMADTATPRDVSNAPTTVTPADGTSKDATSADGTSMNGTSADGTSADGTSMGGTSPDGTSMGGMPSSAAPMQSPSSGAQASPTPSTTTTTPVPLFPADCPIYGAPELPEPDFDPDAGPRGAR